MSESPSIVVDDELYARSRARLIHLVGLDERRANQLVEAAINGSIEQCLDLAGGVSTVPSSVTAIEAERAFFICRRAGRILSQREVEVLFRTTSGKARSIISTMRATYAEALSEQFAARIREDVDIAESGTEATELTWTLTFSEPATFALAIEELRARGLRSAIVDETASRRRLVLKRCVRVDGSEADPLDILDWRRELANGLD